MPPQLDPLTEQMLKDGLILPHEHVVMATVDRLMEIDVSLELMLRLYIGPPPFHPDQVHRRILLRWLKCVHPHRAHRWINENIGLSYYEDGATAFWYVPDISFNGTGSENFLTPMEGETFIKRLILCSLNDVRIDGRTPEHNFLLGFVHNNLGWVVAGSGKRRILDQVRETCKEAQAGAR